MKTHTKTLLAALTATALVFAGYANAEVIKIDFGTSNSPVESGFVAQTSGAATTYGTVASTGSFFNRSATGVYNEAALMGDFTFLNSFGTLTLTIQGDGIAASTNYDITFYSYDSQHGATGGTVTYTGVSGTTGSTSISYSNANLDPNTNTSTSTWTANGSGQIVIDVTGTNEGPRVNGLEITVIPEPGSLALLGLGGLLITRRRRD